MAVLQEMEEAAGVKFVGEEPPAEEPPPPWLRREVVVHYVPTSKSADILEQRQSTRAAIEGRMPQDIVVYTDGSVDQAQQGGAGWVAYNNDGRMTARYHLALGRTASSMQAEESAMHSALQWLLRRERWSTALVVTDSKALVVAIENAQHLAIELQRDFIDLARVGKAVQILWAPGHCGEVGNELADEEAKRGAAAQPQERISVSPAVVRQMLRRRFNNAKSTTQSESLGAVYSKPINHKEEARLTRAEYVDLVRFRTGHHQDFAYWLAKCKFRDSAQCTLCHEEEQTNQHLWTRCPALQMARASTGMGRKMDELCENPIRCMALLRRILRRL